MARRDEITTLLRNVALPLDDDDIAGRLRIDRHYVNHICRQLATEGLTTRAKGPEGKLVNTWTAGATASSLRHGTRMSPAATSRRPRLTRSSRARSNVESLVERFPDCVERFERSRAFPGPSLYFHERAIALRRSHRNVRALMADDRFFEYVYAVLPAWGMHRMGKQSAKVGNFDLLIESFRRATPAIELLWNEHISHLSEGAAGEVAAVLWSILGSLGVSTSATRIVGGSKALHHVLPDLIPPIDRQYTFQFFTGQKAISTGDEGAFLEWFPYLAEIGRRAADHIEDALARGGFMATGPAKVIDNAIIGFMQGDAQS